MSVDLSNLEELPSLKVGDEHSVSGLSSGAFMTVQLHLAHSADFIGAGIIAGGPYRCAESYRGAALGAEDACALSALYVAMTPLTPATAPNPKRLASLARETAAAKHIDPVSNLANDKLYIFTGTNDTVVHSIAVKATRDFYLELGVKEQNIEFVDNVPAGHSIITDNPTDSPLGKNQPPYINYGKYEGHPGFFQSHKILEHIYTGLKEPAENTPGRLVRFTQAPFLDGKEAQASMGTYGFAYIPSGVLKGEKARGVHIVLHGCKQGYDYVNFVAGRADVENQPPYGNRYITTTGYNEMAESNDIIMLYPQATGDDSNAAQNPDGCWDWWGYTSRNTQKPDYYTKNAVQIRAIHGMLKRLCNS
jgi:hypothetical protein